MATNQFFQNFSFAGEQNLLQSLVTESIKMYGIDVYYLPRTLVNEDILFGEDSISSFNAAVAIEMYIKDTEGFGGEGDFLSRFGLELRDTVTFVVSKERYTQVRTEKLITETGWNYFLETGDMILLENGNIDGYSLSSGRPLEGDLIVLTLDGVQTFFEIKFVEHENVFYAHGGLQSYELRCELFEYSSEKVNTGVGVVDAIETTLSTDSLFFELLLETGDKVLLENGGSVILESYVLDTIDTGSDNQYYNTKMNADSIVDFSENNPFSESF